MAKMKADDELEERRMAEESEAQEKTVDSLRDELDSAKTNLTVCQSELAAERADKLLVPPPGARITHNNTHIHSPQPAAVQGKKEELVQEQQSPG